MLFFRTWGGVRPFDSPSGRAVGLHGRAESGGRWYQTAWYRQTDLEIIQLVLRLHGGV